ncbi:MATE family efflux transporter [Bartonella tamiae]|uniref:MATE efflux family protein n=1 Tax=Bartonella tamiae Th239 TaxID=1094558 RepID=J0QTL8_9HYPH|nr:MATE family efflux transporter [Bartonella tamiae]EJF89256.1 MATE efflux family protein [Bartonella tamiae Th239]EJF95582.1 MATE efflux family protein [Bartonella tamiae Th307]
MAQIKLTKSQNLVDGPITQTLLIFAIPTLLSNVLQSLNGSINTIWVGRFLGENALAATANANIIMFLLFSLVFGFGMSATVLIGQAYGRHNINDARQAFGASIGFCILLSFFVSIGGWIFSSEILEFLKTPSEAFSLAKDYLRFIFVAMPAILLIVMIMMGLRGSGDSITPLMFMGVNVVLDIILNPLMILGIGPFPQMGIAGAALATALSSYMALISLIIYIYVKKLPLRLKGNEILYILPPLRLLRIIVFKGFPMSLQMVVMATAGLVMIGLVNREGIMNTAAYNVTQQLWTYIQMPAMAVGAAVSAMAAQNIGAGKWNRIGKITKIGCITTFVMTAILLMIILIFDKSVMVLFLGRESEAATYARHIQLLASWSFLFFGISMIIYATMRANGVVLVPLMCLFIAMYPIRLGFYYVFYGYIGADAIWISFPVGAFALLLMAIVYYRFGHWKKRKQLTAPNFEASREGVEASAEPLARTRPNA